MFRWVVLALLILAPACSWRPSAAPGELRIVQTQGFPSLNPIFISGLGGQEMAALVFSYLVKIDDRGEIVGDAATQAPTIGNGGVSANGLRLTYHLRPGIRFSDGVPLTSQDVAYTIRTLADPRSDAPSRIGFDNVARVATPDPLTVEVYLKRPYAPEVLYLCGPGNAVPILPAHLLRGQTKLAKSPFSSQPVGSGPYIVKRWARDDQLDFSANPAYFGGAPHIARISLRFVPSSNTAETMLRSGEVDAFVNADDTQYARLSTIEHIRVESTPIDGTGALIFNVTDPILRDLRVRRAFAEAIDTERLIPKILLGSVRGQEPGRGLFQWAYDPMAFAMPPYDPHDAGHLLDSAGWRMGPEGIRRRGAMPLVVSMIVRADKPTATTLATAIQAAEHQIGIAVQIRRYPVNLLVATPQDGGPLYGGHYGVAVFPFIAGFDPDVTDQFACDRIPPKGFNKARYCNRDLDHLMQHAASTFSRSERVLLYHEVQRILAADLPLVALYQAASINAFPERLEGESSAVNTAFWNVAAWRLRP